MERGLKAAALFALIVVASADRALLAGKPSGGALHGVAIGYVGQLTVTSATFQVSNYYVTNGNGSWTYSYYSDNGVPNGNNAGQGGVSYATVNSAFQLASVTTQTAAAAASGTQTQAKNQAPPYSPWGTAAATIVASSAVNFFSTGINSVVFPSKNLGVAVGALASPDSVKLQTPSILITIDGGLSWLQATGLPATVATVSVAAAAGPPLKGEYPSQSAGDLTDVYCASKSTCWAVGGNGVGIAGDATAPTTGGDVTGAGLMYATTNGATVWKAVPLFYTASQLAAAAAVSGQTAADLQSSTLIPGILFGVHSDAAGKNVYAVGAPGLTITYATAATLATPTFNVKTTPTILYSGNSGASWTSQTGPAPSSTAYGLLDIAVQKGTTAYAVGGALTVAANDDSSNGQIIYTTNGGFSWNQAVFPWNNGKNAPVFTSVALNGPTVWVGGYTKIGPAAALQNSFYPVKQVIGASGVTAVSGQGYTILVSTDGKTFVGAAAVASFPAGFVQSSGLLSAAITTALTSKDIYGITWDNNNRGFIYGLGFIMGTQDGGKTWVYESPADLVSTSNAFIKSLANVPTSY